MLINKLHVDFEIAAIEVIIKMFPGVTIVGCRFNLCQVW